jgi:hypothetical protein
MPRLLTAMRALLLINPSAPAGHAFFLFRDAKVRIRHHFRTLPSLPMCRINLERVLGVCMPCLPQPWLDICICMH